MKLNKRKSILFVRHFGVISNLGDQLISEATEDYLKKITSKEGVNYKTTSFVPYTQFGKFTLLNLIRGFFFGIKQAFGVDRIVVIGGNLIIPNNTKFSLCFFYYFLLSKLFSCKFSTFGVGVSNPKENKNWRNKLYSISLNSADYICVRDEHSLTALSSIFDDSRSKKRKNTTLSHDCAFLYNQKYFKEPLDTEVVALIPVNYHSATCNESVITLTEKEYLTFHIQLLTNMMERGFKPFLLCTDKADELFALQINQSLGLNIVTPKKVEELFEELKSVKVVAARMHGIIASLLSGNIVAALNWQFKVKSLSEKASSTFPCFEFDLNNIELINSYLERKANTHCSDNGIGSIYEELNVELEKLIRL